MFIIPVSKLGLTAFYVNPQMAPKKEKKNTRKCEQMFCVVLTK